MAIQLITLDNTQLGRLIKKIYDRVVKKSETTEVQSVGIDNTPTKNSTNLVESGGVFDASFVWGVIEHDLSHIGSNNTGYDTVVSNPVWGLIPKEFIEKCQSAVSPTDVVFNENTGYFEMNGLTNLSYREMQKSYYLKDLLNYYTGGDLFMYYSASGKAVLRTLFPRVIYAFGGIGGSYFRLMDNIETLAIRPLSVANPIVAFQNAANLGYMFYNGQKNLKEIFGILRAQANTSFAQTSFQAMYSLERIWIDQLHSNIWFSGSPRLSLESVVYMVSHATNTTAITITLHATAYARCQADTTEYTYNSQTYTGILAYASAKNITIASA